MPAEYIVSEYAKRDAADAPQGKAPFRPEDNSPSFGHLTRAGLLISYKFFNFFILISIVYTDRIQDLTKMVKIGIIASFGR